jgi:hypothetical protein
MPGKHGILTYLKRNLVFLIFFISLFIFIFVSVFKINLLDEGFLLYGSIQISDGKLPYQDFFIPYTPGFFYLHAAIFKLTGINILYPRIIQDMILAFMGIVIFLLSKKIMSENFAVISSVIYVIGVIPGISPWPGWYALFFGFLAIYFVTRFIEKNSDYPSLFYSGIFTVLSILFKQNVGTLTLISIMIFLFIQSFLQKSEQKKEWSKFLAYLSGITLSVIPVVLYLNYFSLTQNFLDDVYYHQIDNYRYSMSVPFPGIINSNYSVPCLLVFYIPVIVFILSIVLVSGKIRASKNEFSGKTDGKTQILILYILFGIFQFFEIYPRSDYPHLLYMMPPVCILLSYITCAGYTRLSEAACGNKIKVKNILCTALCVSFIFIICSFNILSFVLSLPPADGTSLYASDRAVAITSADTKHELEAVTGYITLNTTSQDYILVVPYDAMYYVLTGRDNPSRYNQFLTDFDKTQQEGVIKSLKEKNVRYIIYRNTSWMNFHDTAPEIDGYIQSNYAPDYTVGSISVYRSKTGN